MAALAVPTRDFTDQPDLTGNAESPRVIPFPNSYEPGEVDAFTEDVWSTQSGDVSSEGEPVEAGSPGRTFVVRTRLTAEDTTAPSVDEYVRDYGLAEPLAQLQELLRTVFGDDARLRCALETDWEGGRPEFVVEAVYGFDVASRGIDELAARDEEFLSAYVRRVDQGARKLITLVRFPQDGD